MKLVLNSVRYVLPQLQRQLLLHNLGDDDRDECHWDGDRDECHWDDDERGCDNLIRFNQFHLLHFDFGLHLFIL